MLTPFARLASLASLTVRAPVEFFLFSNQAISCLSIALKVRERRVYISCSPDRVKHTTWQIRENTCHCRSGRLHLGIFVYYCNGGNIHSINCRAKKISWSGCSVQTARLPYIIRAKKICWGGCNVWKARLPYIIRAKKISWGGCNVRKARLPYIIELRK